MPPKGTREQRIEAYTPRTVPLGHHSPSAAGTETPASIRDTWLSHQGRETHKPNPILSPLGEPWKGHRHTLSPHPCLSSQNRKVQPNSRHLLANTRKDVSSHLSPLEPWNLTPPPPPPASQSRPENGPNMHLHLRPWSELPAGAATLAVSGAGWPPGLSPAIPIQVLVIPKTTSFPCVPFCSLSSGRSILS